MTVPFSDLQAIAPSAVIELFELQLVASLHGTADVWRFHAGANLNANGQVVWAGNSYLRFPVEADGFEYSGTGSLPQPSLRVSNIMGTITALLLTANVTTPGNDLIGARFTRIRTLARYLDAVNFPGSVNPYGTPDPTAELPREIYIVSQKKNENRDFVEFTLSSAFDLQGVRAPKRQCISNVCQWVYKSAECGYTEANYFDKDDQPVPSANNDVCGKRLSSCKIRFTPYKRTARMTAGGTSLLLNNTASIITNMAIKGLGIPSGSIVTAVNSNTVITISQAVTVTTNLSLLGTASNTAATMTISSTTGIAVGVSVVGTYIPSGTVVTGITGLTLTLNQRPYSITRNATYEITKTSPSTTYDTYVHIVTTGLSVGMYAWGSNGIEGTITEVDTLRSRIKLSNYGTLPNASSQAFIMPITLYFMPATTSSDTYVFQSGSIPVTFRSDTAGLPFGSFPGLGTYIT